VPHLAVGAVAVAAGLYLGQHASHGLSQAVLLVVGLCAAIGAVQGLVTVVLHVPGWAVSIGAGLALLAWSGRQAAVTLSYDPVPHAFYWFAGFCGVSLAFGLLGLVPALRRTIGRFRPAADPAHRRGVVAGLAALGGTVLSTILAGVGGVLAVSADDRLTPSTGLELTALALGAALLGGTSAYGRRGGIFGTIFAVALLTVVAQYAEATNRGWDAATLAAAAIGLGLVMTRLVERLGRPASGDAVDDDAEWAPKIHSMSNVRSWQTPAPSSAVGLWASDDEWDTAERRSGLSSPG
jgi:ribose/xylose/arabinose/galactoside ABC-type transport system permease subunit